MIVDLPDTTTSKISKKIMALREQGGVIALGRVLTLVVVTRSGLEEEAIEAANEASREHPCRIIVLADAGASAPTRLDAQIRVGGDAGASEVILLRGYGELAEESESLVAALLLPDAPDRGLVAARRPQECVPDLDRGHRAPPDHRLGQRSGPGHGAGKHPPHVQGRRHGPRLDPPDQLAHPAGRGAGPGGRLAGDGRRRRGRLGLPRPPCCSRPG